MVMTKKHYVFFAKCLNDLKDDRADIMHIEERFIDFFAEDNPRFDIVRFKDAVNG